MRKTLLSIALAAAAMLPNVAQAQLVEGSPDCEATVTAPAFTACWGSFSGNNIGSPTVETNVKNFLDGLGYGSFTEAGTTNAGEASGPFEKYDIDLKTGTLFFDTPQSNPFVVALKGSNRFSFFYFANNLPISSFTFTMNGIDLNNQGRPNGLSHATLYTTPGTRVPEPATFGLVAAGMIGLAGVARRRRNQA